MEPALAAATVLVTAIAKELAILSALEVVKTLAA